MEGHKPTHGSYQCYLHKPSNYGRPGPEAGEDQHLAQPEDLASQVAEPESILLCCWGRASSPTRVLGTGGLHALHKPCALLPAPGLYVGVCLQTVYMEGRLYRIQVS